MKKCLIRVGLFICSTVILTYGSFNGTWTVIPQECNIVSKRIQYMTGSGDYVWYYTRRGLCRLNPSTLSRKYYQYPEGCRYDTSTANYYQILVAGDHVLLTSQYQNIDTSYLFSGDRWQALELPSRDDSTGNLCPRTVDYEGRVWLGVRNSILRFDGSRCDTVLAQIPDNAHVSAIEVTPQNGCYFIAQGTDSTVCTVYFIDSTAVPVVSLQNSIWNGFIKDPSGNLYLKSYSQLYSVDPIKGLVYTNLPQSLSTSDIRMIDSDLSIWVGSMARVAGFVSRYSLSTGANIDGGVVGIGLGPVFAACRSGVFVGGRHMDTYWFEGNRPCESFYCSGYGKSSISVTNISHGDRVIFRKDGSFISVRPLNECSANDRILPLGELNDGNLVGVGTFYQQDRKNGIYLNDGTNWTFLSGTENLSFQLIAQSDRGEIWGVDNGNRIYHQSNETWEIINSSNSNLPTDSIKKILFQKSDGSIWLQFDSSVAYSADGHTWTKASFSNDYPDHGRVLFMHNDSAGRMSIWFLSGYNEGKFNVLVKAVHDNGAISYSGLNMPVAASDCDLYEDSRGEVWAILPSEPDSTADATCQLFRYSEGCWTAYGPSELTDNYLSIIGEDARGNMYFECEKFFYRTLVFNRGNIAVGSAPIVTKVKPAFAVRQAGPGVISIEYSLKCRQHVSLALFTPRGIVISKVSGWVSGAGAQRELVKIPAAEGLYIARLITENGTFTSRVMLK